jgi:hypothetical protein
MGVVLDEKCSFSIFCLLGTCLVFYETFMAKLIVRLSRLNEWHYGRFLVDIDSCIAMDTMNMRVQIGATIYLV